MSTNYTGNPIAVEAPAAAPTGGVYPIVVIPADGDALNAASVAQAYKCLADYMAYQMGLSSSYSFSVNEQFTGDDVIKGVWITTATSTGSAMAVVDDAAAGGFGALRHTLVTTGGQNYVKTQPMPILTKDFMFSAHVRKTALVTGSTYVAGINGAASGSCYFAAYDGGNLQAHVDGIDNATGVALTTTYKLLEIRRKSGVVTFYVDGTSVYSAAFATSIAAHWATSFLDSSAGAAVVFVDDINVGVAR